MLTSKRYRMQKCHIMNEDLFIHFTSCLYSTRYFCSYLTHFFAYCTVTNVVIIDTVPVILSVNIITLDIFHELQLIKNLNISLKK